MFGKFFSVFFWLYLIPFLIIPVNGFSGSVNGLDCVVEYMCGENIRIMKHTTVCFIIWLCFIILIMLHWLCFITSLLPQYASLFEYFHHTCIPLHNLIRLRIQKIHLLELIKKVEGHKEHKVVWREHKVVWRELELCDGNISSVKGT